VNFLSKMWAGNQSPWTINSLFAVWWAISVWLWAGWSRDLGARLLPRKLQCMLGAIAQILKKILRRYIQNRMSQKISITAKP
jgi:hypothetical protein